MLRHAYITGYNTAFTRYKIGMKAPGLKGPGVSPSAIHPIPPVQQATPPPGQPLAPNAKPTL